MKRPLVIAAVCLASGLLLFVMWKGFGTDVHAVPFKLDGKPAPDFTMKRLDNGQPVSLSQFKGKPVILNFWASWCGPCATEHPHLDRGFALLGDRVQFLGIVFEDTEESTKKFLATNGMSFPQLFDATSTVAVDYGVSGVPETYFIDRDGIIRGKHVGPIHFKQLEARAKELLP